MATTKSDATTLLEAARKWEALITASREERGPFTKRFCAFKAAELRQRAANLNKATT